MKKPTSTTVERMFGLEAPSAAAPVTLEERTAFLADFVRFVYASETMGYESDPAADDLTRSFAFLDRRPDLAERRLVLIRHALTEQGDLTDAAALRFARRLSVAHGELRRLLLLVEVHLASMLTGEPRRLLPWDGGPFR